MTLGAKGVGRGVPRWIERRHRVSAVIWSSSFRTSAAVLPSTAGSENQ